MRLSHVRRVRHQVHMCCHDSDIRWRGRGINRAIRMGGAHAGVRLRQIVNSPRTSADEQHLQRCGPRHRYHNMPGFAAMGSKQTCEPPSSVVQGMIRRVKDVSNRLPKLQRESDMHLVGSEGAGRHSRFRGLAVAEIKIKLMPV
jgi:hypothetical protein